MIAPDQFIQFILSAMAIITLLLLAIVVYVSGQLRFKIRTHQQTNRLLTALVEEQERILNEVSVEIHDNVVQLTNFSLMTLKGALKEQDKSQSDNRVNDAIRLIEEVNIAFRTMSHSLNGEYVRQQGLLAMLERESDYLCKTGKVHCDFRLTGTPVHLGEEAELVLYRIAQEAIHNAVKHGHPTNIIIELSYLADKMMMGIIDNGAGFKTSNETIAAGIGITNMRHRATLIGASLQLSSTPGAGTQVVLTMPVKKV